MQLLPLQEVASQIKPGMTLAWGVRDSNGKLLLARGHRVADAAMLQALLARGVFVDANEFRAVSGCTHVTKPREGFFGRWRLSSARLNTLLTAPQGELRAALNEVVDVLMTLADRYPDKVLFQILRHDQSRLQAYGVSHSLHSGAVCCLTGKRLGWSADDRRMLVGAALSMNLSMIELQGRLAVQGAKPTPEQRAAIEAHPRKSVEMLEAAGVRDPLWLAAVEQHHERVDGSGYPAGIRAAELDPAACLLAAADVLHALGEARPHRPALGLPEAAKVLSGLQLDGDAIRAVLDGAGAPPPQLPPLPAALTERELEVLRRLVAGRTKREIAAELVISQSTVHTHTVHIYGKCEVSTRAGLAMFAMQHGLAPLGASVIQID